MPGKSRFLKLELIENCKQTLKKQGQRGEIARRLQAIISADNYSISEVAKIYSVSRNTIANWIKSFEKSSEKGLCIKKGRGRKPIIDSIKAKEIKNMLDKNPNITIDKIKIFIMEKYNLKTSRSTIYRVIKKLGFAHITARPIHYKSNIQEQEIFKKN